MLLLRNGKFVIWKLKSLSYFFVFFCFVFCFVFFILVFVVVNVSVLKPVEAVWTDGLRESSIRVVLSFIQKSGVWHSIERFGLDLTALAYDEVAGDEEGGITRRLASPYGIFFSALTFWISFYLIHTGQVFDEE